MCTEDGHIFDDFVGNQIFIRNFQVENAISDEERALCLRQSARNLDIQNRTFGGAHRYCHYTKCIKPDRSHYCSVTGFQI